MKKALVSILAAVMLLSTVSVAAFAETITEGGTYTGDYDQVNVGGAETTVIVNGDINCNETRTSGVYAFNGASVTVNGEVISDGIDGRGITAEGGSTVNAEGVTSDYDAVQAFEGSSVTVAGDAIAENGSSYGIWATDSTVIVEGTVSGGSCDVVLDGSSEALVGKLEHGTLWGDPSKVYYIINGENVTVDGSETKHGYEVAGENAELTVSAAEGCTDLTVESEYATIVPNGDGTYAVTVICGGDLRFKAIARVLPSGEVVFEYYEGPAPETAKDEEGCYIVGYRFSHFQKALVDGEEIVVDTDYSVKQESHGLTLIKLADSFNSTLAAGKHTLSVVFTDGTFDINFEA